MVKGNTLTNSSIHVIHVLSNLSSIWNHRIVHFFYWWKHNRNVLKEHSQVHIILLLNIAMLHYFLNSVINYYGYYIPNFHSAAHRLRTSCCSDKDIYQADTVFYVKKTILKSRYCKHKICLSIRLWGSWVFFFLDIRMQYFICCFVLLFLNCKIIDKKTQNYSIKKQCLAAGAGNLVFSAWQIFLQEFTNLKTKWYEGKFSVMTEITLCETVLN